MSDIGNKGAHMYLGHAGERDVSWTLSWRRSHLNWALKCTEAFQKDGGRVDMERTPWGNVVNPEQCGPAMCTGFPWCLVP